MTQLGRIQPYERFLAARQFTGVGSGYGEIEPFEFPEPEPASQACVMLVLEGRPEKVRMVRPVSGSESAWTIRDIVTLAAEGGHAVSDELERVRAEKETRERISQAIESLRALDDGWAGGDSLAPSERAIKEALLFVSLLPHGLSEPTVCAAEDGEIVIDWVSGAKKAIVGLEGDGHFGYAVHEGGRYKPGKQEGDLSKHEVPSDLKGYLESMMTR